MYAKNYLFLTIIVSHLNCLQLDILQMVMLPYHVEYLDSPSTTSEVTYKLYGSHETGTASEVGPDGDDEQYTILTEVAD